MRAVYEGVHGFRDRTRLIVGVFLFTVAIQAVRVLAIWATAQAVGIDLSPRLYYVMGPLFFLVLLVPFTLNGFAVREAFFVSFLGDVGVDPDQAFAAGFLFFLVTVAMALPGGAILLWEGLAGGRALHQCLTRASSSSPTTRCRGSSSASRASADEEVVVVDNGSTDGTVDVVREFSRRRV